MTGLKKYKTVNAIIEDFDAIDFGNVIYGEYSHSGAMGMAGHVWLYVLDDGIMTLYKADIHGEDKGETWNHAQKLITQHEDLFEFYSGGMGNGVLIRKDTMLEPVDNGDEDFYLAYDGYMIDPSVRGVFNSLVDNLAEGLTMDKQAEAIGSKKRSEPKAEPDIDIQNKTRGMLVGLATGDALGMAVEFGWMARNVQKHWDGQMHEGFNPKGYYTDDTAMALCMADSLLECGGYNSYDVMTKYVKWARNGYRDSQGEPANDIGRQTLKAVEDFVKQPNVYKNQRRVKSAGNGGLMRLAPAVIVFADRLQQFDIKQSHVHNTEVLKPILELARLSARETHFSYEVEATTMMLATAMVMAATDNSKQNIMTHFMRWTPNFDGHDVYMEHMNLRELALEKDGKPFEDRGGYTLDALAIALWGFYHYDNFKDGMVAIIKLGGDTDTNAAIYGQIAGAYYGYTDIPVEWLQDLVHHDEIVSIADQLTDKQPNKIVKTRFEEDGELFVEYKPES